MHSRSFGRAKPARPQDDTPTSFSAACYLNRSVRVEGPDGFQHRVSDDLQAVGAEFVERVLWRVVEDVVVAVIEVDEVGYRDADFGKRQVIVFDGDLPREEVRL